MASFMARADEPSSDRTGALYRARPGKHYITRLAEAVELSCPANWGDVSGRMNGLGAALEASAMRMSSGRPRPGLQLGREQLAGRLLWKHEDANPGCWPALLREQGQAIRGLRGGLEREENHGVASPPRRAHEHPVRKRDVSLLPSAGQRPRSRDGGRQEAPAVHDEKPSLVVSTTAESPIRTRCAAEARGSAAAAKSESAAARRSWGQRRVCDPSARRNA